MEILVEENSCAACGSRWIQSKEINRFTTVFQPSKNRQEPYELPKYLQKYHNERQSSKNKILC
jgi:hypothetical protein